MERFHDILMKIHCFIMFFCIDIISRVDNKEKRVSNGEVVSGK